MNKHILFVMKWLDNPDQFTREQIEISWRAAYDAYMSASAVNTHGYMAVRAAYIEYFIRGLTE